MLSINDFRKYYSFFDKKQPHHLQKEISVFSGEKGVRVTILPNTIIRRAHHILCQHFGLDSTRYVFVVSNGKETRGFSDYDGLMVPELREKEIILLVEKCPEVMISF